MKALQAHGKGSVISMIEFFLPMKKIPTVTHQEKKINFRDKKIYEPRELAEARALFMELLSEHRPPKPFPKGAPVRAEVYWQFPLDGHREGELKVTKPDLDNHQKLLQDCMTKSGFWHDDCQISLLTMGKIYSQHVGVYISAELMLKEGAK